MKWLKGRGEYKWMAFIEMLSWTFSFGTFSFKPLHNDCHDDGDDDDDDDNNNNHIFIALGCISCKSLKRILACQV